MAEAELNRLLTQNQDIKSDILKVAHHGSKSGTSEALLERVTPRYAVVSVGENSANLPSAETINMLQDTCQILRTDQNGTILIAWEPEGYHVKTSR